MKKNTTNANLHEIRKITSKLPKTINEALNFEGAMGEEENEELLYDDSEMGMEHNLEEKPMKEEPVGMDVAAFLDDIRKKALKGMAELAEYPESPEYQQLKKVWSLVDKKPEQQNPQQTA